MGPFRSGILVCALSSAVAGGAAAEGVRLPLVTAVAPLSVRGVNYYPAETPWSGMWCATPPEVWERDMALAASLHINAVRTFLMFTPGSEEAGLTAADGTPTALHLEKIDTFLGAAARHGIRAILCFEFGPTWLEHPEEGELPRWQRAMSAVVEAHRGDGRVLMWDLVNEPDSDGKWTDAMRSYVAAAIPFIKRRDPDHLTTVGLTFRIDRLAEVGLPDVIQYHEYAPKNEVFALGVERVAKPVAGMRGAGGTRPVLIGEFGMSTARDPEHGAGPDWQDRLPPAPGTEADQERLYGVILQAAEDLELAGVMPWCLHSYPTQERGFLTPTESMFGLVRHDGTLKPAAVLLSRTYERWSRERPASE